MKPLIAVFIGTLGLSAAASAEIIFLDNQGAPRREVIARDPANTPAADRQTSDALGSVTLSALAGASSATQESLLGPVRLAAAMQIAGSDDGIDHNTVQLFFTVSQTVPFVYRTSGVLGAETALTGFIREANGLRLVDTFSAGGEARQIDQVETGTLIAGTTYVLAYVLWGSDSADVTWELLVPAPAATTVLAVPLLLLAAHRRRDIARP